jgi:hypothetical protein
VVTSPVITTDKKVYRVKEHRNNPMTHTDDIILKNDAQEKQQCPVDAMVLGCCRRVIIKLGQPSDHARRPVLLDAVGRSRGQRPQELGSELLAGG